MDPIECGKAAASHFLFNKHWRNLNHGSFGTYPMEVRKAMRHLQDVCEYHPDKFIRYDFPRLNDAARSTVAKLINAPEDSVVFVSNATLAINTILRNLVYQPGDVIIYFSTIYGACHKTIEYLVETTPVTAKGIQYTYPISDDALCKRFSDTIAAVKADGKTPKLAVFDTIVSLPGVRVPFERLTQICREQDVLSCIDGAHSVGQIPMDIAQLDPDFYFSNCHKWLHVPRGCCVLYVAERNQALMRSSLPTSHGFVPRNVEGGIVNPLPPSSKSEFVNQFEFVGTLDNSPYLCVGEAVRWRERVKYGEFTGEDAIMKYCVDLARRGGDAVAMTLGGEPVLDNEEGTLRDCAFANVILPLRFDGVEQGGKMAQWLSKTLVDEYETFIATLYHDGKIWVRLSAQIYLTMEDFEFASKVLKEVCERANKGEWKDDSKAKL